MTEQGPRNSEARKRLQEKRGEPEALPFTEPIGHPLRPDIAEWVKVQSRLYP